MPNEQDPTGGLGEPSDRAKRWEQRQHLRVIEAAVYQGWDIPAEASVGIPAALKAIIDDPNASVRDRIRASECLASLRKDKIEAAIQLDRISRLDAGTATDRVEIMDSLTDAQLDAVARAVIKEQPCPPAKPKRKP